MYIYVLHNCRVHILLFLLNKLYLLYFISNINQLIQRYYLNLNIFRRKKLNNNPLKIMNKQLAQVQHLKMK